MQQFVNRKIYMDSTILVSCS